MNNQVHRAHEQSSTFRNNAFTCIVAYTYTTLFTAIHVSLSLCLSAMYPFKLHMHCVMVGVVTGKMFWPAMTVRKDVRDFLQENKISLSLTFFNLIELF